MFVFNIIDIKYLTIVQLILSKYWKRIQRWHPFLSVS